MHEQKLTQGITEELRCNEKVFVCAARAMQRPPTPAEPDQSCRKQLALVAMYHTHEAAVNIDLKGGPIVNGNFD